jgi:hypothetical protein
MIKPFARALRESDYALAQALWMAATARLGVAVLPDHEGELFEGVLVPREEALSPTAVGELARSWEQLDRAYGPCEDDDLRDELEEKVRELATTTGLTADLGDTHLFVLLGSQGEAAAVGRWTSDGWDELVGAHRDDAEARDTAEAFDTYRELFP